MIYRILWYLVDPVIPSETNALDRITGFTILIQNILCDLGALCGYPPL